MAHQATTAGGALMRSNSKSEPHKTLVEALDYRRSTPLLKYRQYVNNPTIGAGSPIVKIITRLSMLEIKISASSGEYSVCWRKPYEAGIHCAVPKLYRF
jgi:hypothetical protein